MNRRKRPFSVTILALGVLTVDILFWVRFFLAIRDAEFIAALSPSVSPAYVMLTGLVFGLAGLPVAPGLWFGRPWAPPAARRLAVALAVFYWLDFLLFVVSGTARGTWPFAAGATVLALAWMFGVLARPGVRAYFENSKK